MKTRKISDFISRAAFAALLVASCGYHTEAGDDEFLLSGGDLTTFDSTVNAFDQPPLSLTVARQLEFADGNAEFNTAWTSPGSTAREGLGPTFNQTSCQGCHSRDGRGRPPLGSETAFATMLFRLSGPGTDSVGGPVPLPDYGGQLQDKSTPGVPAEGSVDLSRRRISGTYADGTVYELEEPLYTFTFAFAHPGTFYFSPRTAPAIPGMGLLAAVPDATLRELERRQAIAGSEVSGRINYVWDTINARVAPGRFGWKANVATLREQVAGAAIGDMGITTPLFPYQNCPPAQTACVASPPGDNGFPTEASAFQLDSLVLYNHLVGVPVRRNAGSPSVIRGRALFRSLGCNSCHIETLQTGAYPGFPELENQIIHPYTDLLVHDMGPALADNRPDFGASGSEWRTPPLWGIGLIEKVNGHNRLLHDGRARGFAEAILWHGGEAAAARERFRNLSRDDRNALVDFLYSL